MERKPLAPGDPRPYCKEMTPRGRCAFHVMEGHEFCGSHFSAHVRRQNDIKEKAITLGGIKFVPFPRVQEPMKWDASEGWCIRGNAVDDWREVSFSLEPLK